MTAPKEFKLCRWQLCFEAILNDKIRLVEQIVFNLYRTRCSIYIGNNKNMVFLASFMRAKQVFLWYTSVCTDQSSVLLKILAVVPHARSDLGYCMNVSVSHYINMISYLQLYESMTISNQQCKLLGLRPKFDGGDGDQIEDIIGNTYSVLDMNLWMVSTANMKLSY